jgi:hypothetical protein
MRAFLFPAAGQEHNKMVKHAKKIFLATKPAPVTESRFKDRDVFQLGSMSHFLNTRVPGYHDLPGYPEVAPGRLKIKPFINSKGSIVAGSRESLFQGKDQYDC